MSIDWNQKLGLHLQVLCDRVFCTLRSPSSPPQPADESVQEGSEDEAGGTGSQSVCDVVTFGADRPPIGPCLASGQIWVNWRYQPELTHPISAARYALDQVECTSALAAFTQAIDQLGEIGDGDPRKQFLWAWRHLPSGLAALDGGLGRRWWRLPADPRCPDHSVWQYAALCTALGSAGEQPCFLMFDLSMVVPASGPKTLADACASSAVLSEISWAAMRVVAEEFGPDAIVYPSLRHQPLVDNWLREQGIGDAGEDAAASICCLPLQFIAIVPSEEVQELAQRCTQAAKEHWALLAAGARERFQSDGWAKKADPVWNSIWTAQTAGYVSPAWAAAPICADTTGIGALLSSREVNALDKWIASCAQSSGLEFPGAGSYYGLWQDVVRASVASQAVSVHAAVTVTCRDQCSSCGRRGVLADSSDDQTELTEFGLASQFWHRVAQIESAGANRVSGDERLCTVCATNRLVASQRPASPVSLLASANFLRKIQKERPNAWASLCESSNAPEAIDEPASEIGARVAQQIIASKASRSASGQADSAGSELVRAIGFAPVNSYAVVLFNGDHLTGLMRGGGDSKAAATVRSLLHSGMPSQLLRSRARYADILDSPVFAGPLRNLAISEALTDYCVGSVAPIAAYHDAQVIHAWGDELLIAVGAGQALSLAQALRDRYRESFVDLGSQTGDYRLGLHLGPVASTSAVIAVANCDQPLAVPIAAARMWMTQASKEVAGKDAVTVCLCERPGAEPALCCKWADLDETLAPAVRFFANCEDSDQLVRSIFELEPALVDRDLDKIRGDSRLALVRGAIANAAGATDGADEVVVRAMLRLIDQNLLTVIEGDVARSLDGVRVAHGVARGVQ